LRIFRRDLVQFLAGGGAHHYYFEAFEIFPGWKKFVMLERVDDCLMLLQLAN
jgi:hypothetical protein